MKGMFIIATAALLLTGCASTPTGNIEAFGVAASWVTDKIDAVIGDYNTANINDRLVAMAQSKRKYVQSDFDPIQRLIIRDADKRHFALYRANRALGDYAKALSALANAGAREELALAGVKLSKSLEGMNQQYRSLAETDTDLISADSRGTISRVVAELSTYYVDTKRGKALKAVIIAADDSVQAIGTVINDELLTGVIEGRLYAMRSNELAGYFADYNAKSSKGSFASRKKSLDAIYKKYIAMQSTTATLVQAQHAISSVMAAHAKLKSELANDRFSSQALFDAIAAIKTVHSNFDDLEALMMRCDTEIVADDAKGIICQAAKTAG